MPRFQPPTFLSVGDLGRNCDFKMPQVGDRLSRLVAAASSQGGAGHTASSQGGAGHTASSKGKPALHIDDVGFLLVDMDQAARPDIHKSHKIGLVVSVLGMHSPTPEYPQGVQQVNCAIQWENGRNEQFAQCVPHIITAFSQGKNVMVHCIQSYHRGPIGVAAICKALFGFNVRSVLKFIASRRDVHLAYGTNEKLVASLAEQSLGPRVCSFTSFPALSRRLRAKGARLRAKGSQHRLRAHPASACGTRPCT